MKRSILYAMVVSASFTAIVFGQMPNPDDATRAQAAQARLAERIAAKKAAETQPALTPNPDDQIKQLRAENARLLAEVRELKQQLAALTAKQAAAAKPPVTVKKPALAIVPEPKIGGTEQDIVDWVHAPTRYVNGSAVDHEWMNSSVASETASGKVIRVCINTGGGVLRDILSYTIQDGKIVQIDRL